MDGAPKDSSSSGATHPPAYLIQLLLPLPRPSCAEQAQREFSKLRSVLVERFGGITTYQRSPAQGQWKDENRSGEAVEHDDVVVYEVMATSLDRDWWHDLRHHLEAALGQEELVIRAHRIERL